MSLNTPVKSVTQFKSCIIIGHLKQLYSAPHLTLRTNSSSMFMCGYKSLRPCSIRTDSKIVLCDPVCFGLNARNERRELRAGQLPPI